jgi:hypothetical protein
MAATASQTRRSRRRLTRLVRYPMGRWGSRFSCLAATLGLASVCISSSQ